jgi:hypothetical protein
MLWMPLPPLAPTPLGFAELPPYAGLFPGNPCISVAFVVGAALLGSATAGVAKRQITPMATNSFIIYFPSFVVAPLCAGVLKPNVVMT